MANLIKWINLKNQELYFKMFLLNLKSILKILIIISLLNGAITNTTNGIFHIPDQQAFIGKLFYYQIELPYNVQNFTIKQAGFHNHINNDHQNDNESTSTTKTSSSSISLLPEWLYFDPETNLLFGIAHEKRIYFIQVEAILNKQKYEDIFVIETIEKPKFFKNNRQSILNDKLNSDPFFECRIEFKKNYKTVKDIYLNLILKILKDYYKNSLLNDKNNKQNLEQDEITMKKWLKQFNVQIFTTEQDSLSSSISLYEPTVNLKREYHIYYEVQECIKNNEQNNLQLDETSHQLLKQLNQLNIDSELIQIMTHTDFNFINNYDNNQKINDDIEFLRKNEIESTKSNFINDISSASYHKKHHLSHHNQFYNENGHQHHHHHHHHHHQHQDGHRNYHKRSNAAYIDDDNLYETPTLQRQPTLKTSTIDISSFDNQQINAQQNQPIIALSRTVIPSMISPSFPSKTSYPQLYNTPVLMPEISIITKSITLPGLDPAEMFTPVFTNSMTSEIPTSSLIEPTKTFDSTNQAATTTVKAFDSSQDSSSSIILRFDQEKQSSTTTTTTSTTEQASTTTTIVNHRPFVNKRISKLSITAGKFWQFSIPEDTFYDKEDGNTRQLRIGFFKDSEILPADYWIQFDNENQYLYALPTDDDIGRHRFSLVAVDLQGGEATEIIEIYVRQSRQSLSHTHKFILANITWDSDRYPERIQAVSSILQRMVIQVFEEMPSGGINEAAQRQVLLKHINVLKIEQNSKSLQWSITWTNDSLKRHPCPSNEINLIFSRLYDITYPEDELGFMQPSQELRTALTPDFTIEHVKRLFIARSACGSHALPSDGSSSRHKEKIVFSNRLNRIGPYRLGSAFKFQIPKDTVYSMTRQVDTRQLVLSIAPMEPEIDLPEFIYFDTHEQTIYGLPYKQEHIRTYELKLIAEDTVHGGSEQDIFILDVEHDFNPREDYLFEITMSFLYRNIELTSRSQQKLTSKDFYQVAHTISTKLMGNGNLEAFRMLDIARHRFTKIQEPTIDHHHQLLDDNYEVNQAEQTEMANKFRRDIWSSSRILSRHLRSLTTSNSIQSDYYYEFTWTNRTLVTSYLHSPDAIGGGSLFETKTCPKDIISRDIYYRLFPRSAKEFLKNTNLNRNHTRGTFLTRTNLDVMDVYNQLFEPLEANLEFLSVEWQPKSVCFNTAGLDNRILGAKPIRDLSEDDNDDLEDETDEELNKENDIQSKTADKSQSPQSETEDPSINIPVDPSTTDSGSNVDEYPNMAYFGDRLLAMLIPPVAILIALLFAVTIGCCFHRANQRRKALGTGASAYHEESPSLYRQRVPIQFEFERGGLRASGIHPQEQEAMLESKFSKHPVQIVPPPKIRGPGGPSNLPAVTAAVTSHQHQQRHPHANLPYQMLPRM